jgi:phosphoglycerate dehydrogenase-like enzyme
MPEPLPPHDPLWNAPNLLIAPHTGGAGSPQGVRRLVAVIAGNVARVRSGSPPAGLLRLPAMKD